jgi:cation:H+ antiporter
VSGAIIGTTIAAFATSSPEFAVAVTSAMQHTPQVSFGDALGSNVVNIALILGLALLFSPVHAPRGSIRRDFPVALAVPALTALACSDGVLSRFEASSLMVFFVLWLSGVIISALRQRDSTAATSTAKLLRGHHAAAIGLGGLLLLIAAGELIVSGARGIAAAFGISDFVIGATIVAAGTSVPELATALIAKWRGRDDIGLGTLLGSNIFNGLWIVPVAALIHPVEVDLEQAGTAVVFGMAALLVAFPPQSGSIDRGRGAVLLFVYAAYVTTVLLA